MHSQRETIDKLARIHNDVGIPAPVRHEAERQWQKLRSVVLKEAGNTSTTSHRMIMSA